VVNADYGDWDADYADLKRMVVMLAGGLEMRYTGWPVVKKKGNDLEIGEVTAEYTDGKLTGLQVGRDKHGWFAFKGGSRTVSRMTLSALTGPILRGFKDALLY